MDLTPLANLGEFIGGLAVLVTYEVQWHVGDNRYRSKRGFSS